MKKKSKVSAIITGAGKGKRIKNSKKIFISLNKKPILVHTLQKFSNCFLIDEIILVTRKSHIPLCKELIKNYKIRKVKDIVVGGKERQDSVWSGIKNLPKDTFIVLIHDANRPLVSLKIIKDVIKATKRYGAAIAGVPAKDTLKEIEFKKILKTLDRDKIFLAQTPQGFKYELIFSAHLTAEKENFHSTDDAELVERFGSRKIRIVNGSYKNIKITTKEDLIFAENIVSKYSLF